MLYIEVYARILMSRNVFIRSFLSGEAVNETKANQSQN